MVQAVRTAWLERKVSVYDSRSIREWRVNERIFMSNLNKKLEYKYTKMVSYE